MQAILESPPRDDVDPVEPTQSALGLFAGRAITLLLVAGPLVAFVLATRNSMFCGDANIAPSGGKKIREVNTGWLLFMIRIEILSGEPGVYPPFVPIVRAANTDELDK